jgi:hypothetical protein
VINHRTIVLGLVAAVVAQACSTATPPMQPSTPQRQSSVQSTAPAKNRSTQGSQTPSEAGKAAAHQEKRAREITNKTPPIMTKSVNSAAKERPKAQAQNGQKRRSILLDAPPSMPVGQTSEEQRARLERELNTSLSAFDGRLLRERELLSDTGATGQSDAVGGTTSGAAGVRSQKASGSSAYADKGSGPGFTPGGQIPKAQDNSQGHSPSGPQPMDIAGGNDDDVIARQLREAAENETDPVLRERLWQEYRDYKNATASQTGSGSPP